MPILDVEIVVADTETISGGLAAKLADAAGEVFGSPQGATWVRVRPLPRRYYAECRTPQPEGWQSVFVTVLKAHRPTAGELAKEIQALTDAVARICDRAPEQVHILYEPEATGRIAFGGKLKT